MTTVRGVVILEGLPGSYSPRKIVKTTPARLRHHSRRHTGADVFSHRRPVYFSTRFYRGGAAFPFRDLPCLPSLKRLRQLMAGFRGRFFIFHPYQPSTYAPTTLRFFLFFLLLVLLFCLLTLIFAFSWASSSIFLPLVF